MMASSSSDELITAVSGSFTPSDAQAFALEYLKSHPSGNTPLQKLRLFQSIAIAEAVVEVRSRKDSVSVTSLIPFFIRRKRAFDQEATASQLFVARCEAVRAQLIRFLPDNVRAPLALTVSKPGAAGNTVALAIRRAAVFGNFCGNCGRSKRRSQPT